MSNAFGGVLAHPLLFDELLEPSERCFRSSNARFRVLPRFDAVVLEPKHADHRGQRQTHADKRRR